MRFALIALLVLAALRRAWCIPTGGKFTGSIGNNHSVVHHLSLPKDALICIAARPSHYHEFDVVIYVNSSPCANYDGDGAGLDTFIYKRHIKEIVESTNELDWDHEDAELTYEINHQNVDTKDYFLNLKNCTLCEKPIFMTPSVGVYIVEIGYYANPLKENLSMTYTVEMKSWYGYLGYVDYPGLIFYGLMIGVYIIFGIIWITVMAIWYKDLIHLQFWIAVVIFLGMMEKAFFVSMYSTVNQTGEHVENRPLYIVAELISSAKKSLARMLLIIVSLGYGTVKPTLASHLGRVIAAGAIYGVFSFLDGITRSYSYTSDTDNSTEYFTMIPLAVIDSIILYWVFVSILETRKILRLRKNVTKLSFYTHLLYTILFAVVVAVLFMIWSLVYLRLPACVSDFKEVWFDDAFWHILFSFLLAVIMILWRPNTNSARFAYAVVENEDDESDIEQGPNENFGENIKLRKTEQDLKFSPNSQVEDDLKWVEENLPSSAVDKILPLIADSDEELMTTKFEQSKMD